VIDTDGKILIERSGQRQIAPAGAPDRQGLTFQDRFDVPRGRHEVRFGVRLGDKVGTVVAYVEVPDFGGSRVALSGLLVSAAPQGSAQTGAAACGSYPTALSACSGIDGVGRTLPSRNTPSDRVSLDTIVKNESGAAVLTKSSAASASGTGEPGERLFNVDVPLSSLAPGKYWLVVNASVRGSSRRLQHAKCRSG
jgi:hypothetical protein